jgi:hypothetical protein
VELALDAVGVEVVEEGAAQILVGQVRAEHVPDRDENRVLDGDQGRLLA